MVKLLVGFLFNAYCCRFAFKRETQGMIVLIRSSSPNDNPYGKKGKARYLFDVLHMYSWGEMSLFLSMLKF